MIPYPTRLGDVPPGARVLGGDGQDRWLWFIPPNTVVSQDAAGAIVQGEVPGDAPNHLFLMYVPTEAEAIANLCAAFPGTELINPTSE